MVKREIPELWEDVSEIKYIGSYLRNALNGEGIFTCGDLVETLVEFGEAWEHPVMVRRRVRNWLRELLTNARAGECCYPGSRVIDGREYAYLARQTNQKGYNAILKLWRHYAIPPYRNWIPAAFRGLIERKKYARRCDMDRIFFRI
jgi:hypothetical protein